MVPGDPQLGDVFKYPIFRDLFWGEVVVIIQNGLGSGIFGIQFDRKFILQQKIIIYKGIASHPVELFYGTSDFSSIHII